MPTHDYEVIRTNYHALDRLNQRRGCASLQLEEAIDRAMDICSRASSAQYKVMQQRQELPHLLEQARASLHGISAQRQVPQQGLPSQEGESHKP